MTEGEESKEARKERKNIEVKKKGWKDIKVRKK
jgi:hypothetical protein